MKQADYIILTSDYEGFSVIYLEALALNKSIITTIPTSDNLLDISDYAYIISKDSKKMVEEVKQILKKNPKETKIDLDKIQKDRVRQLETIINC